jgi:RNA polymerase sigma-70 factor (ECF subfamily)
MNSGRDCAAPVGGLWSVAEVVLDRDAGGTRPTAPSDRELARRLGAGDMSAFERMYSLYGDRMKSVAMNLTGNVADAEDAVQEAFLRAYRSAASFKGDSALSTWIHRIVVNVCHDLRRRKSVRPEGRAVDLDEATLPRFEAPAQDHPLRLALEQCLDLLEPRQRDVFVLFDVEGFTHREIGGLLGMAEGTSKALLFEARRSLRKVLGARHRAGGLP